MSEEITKKIDRLEGRIAKIEELLLTTQPKQFSKKKMSVKEFIISKKPKNDVQKTLLISYYLENYDNLEFFNLKDIEDGFRKAKEKVPGNISDKVYKTIKNGHIMEAKGKKDNLKAWTLTNSGESFVENDFKK